MTKLKSLVISAFALTLAGTGAAAAEEVRYSLWAKEGEAQHTAAPHVPICIIRSHGRAKQLVQQAGPWPGTNVCPQELLVSSFRRGDAPADGQRCVEIAYTAKHMQRLP